MRIMRPPTFDVLDKPACDIIERAWREWCRKQNCTVTGEDSLFDVLKYDLIAGLEAGGMLIKKVMGADNEFGFALKIFEIDHLDVNKTQGLANGGRIVMGTEKNMDGKTLAYHLTENHPGDLLFGNTRYNSIRYSADEFIHHFIKERPNQSLGVPGLANSLDRIRQLIQYEMAEVVAARAASEKGGYFTSEAGDTYQGEDELDANGNPIATIKDSEPGQDDVLPKGMTFVPYDPTHPTSQYGQFTKDQMLGIAAGWGVDFATLTGDLSSANYSSMRSGKLESQETWKKLQSHQITHLVREIFDAWLPAAILSGAVNLPMSKLKLLNKPVFKGRRWPWVDPEKDIRAAQLAVDAGFTSRGEIIAESDGDYDFEDLVNVLKEEKEMAVAAGVSFTVSGASAPPATDGVNMEQVKAEMDTYGVGVRAGAITPSQPDEDHFRAKLGLPPTSQDANTMWKDEDNVRRPVTLLSVDKERANDAAVVTEDEKQQSEK
jgi:lambda family phage portal protein